MSPGKDEDASVLLVLSLVLLLGAVIGPVEDVLGLLPALPVVELGIMTVSWIICVLEEVILSDIVIVVFVVVVDRVGEVVDCSCEDIGGMDVGTAAVKIKILQLCRYLPVNTRHIYYACNTIKIFYTILSWILSNML